MPIKLGCSSSALFTVSFGVYLVFLQWIEDECKQLLWRWK